MPAGTSLILHEVADAKKNKAAGGIWQDLSRANSLVIPANSTHWFSIEFRPNVVWVMNFDLGWNFFSLPIEPSITNAATLFSAIMEVGVDEPVVVFGPLISGYLWSWNAARNAFGSASEVHGLTGYWAYAPRALSIRVEGAPANPNVPVLKGNNALGVPVVLGLTTDISRSPLWWWNAITSQYKSVEVGGELFPGVGYWLYAPAPTTVNLDP